MHSAVMREGGWKLGLTIKLRAAVMGLTIKEEATRKRWPPIAADIKEEVTRKRWPPTLKRRKRLALLELVTHYIEQVVSKARRPQGINR